MDPLLLDSPSTATTPSLVSLTKSKPHSLDTKENGGVGRLRVILNTLEYQAATGAPHNSNSELIDKDHSGVFNNTKQHFPPRPTGFPTLPTLRTRYQLLNFSSLLCRTFSSIYIHICFLLLKFQYKCDLSIPFCSPHPALYLRRILKTAQRDQVTRSMM